MENISLQKIQDFLEELGSQTPAPGGGSVAALSAALASRLTEMVANLTIGKKKFSENQEGMFQAIKIARSLSNDFMILAQRDTEAFSHFMEALSLPKETDATRDFRKEAMQAALKESTLVPLEVIELIKRLAENSLSVALLGNPNAFTDAAVSALLAEAAAKGAALNARANMASLNDTDFVHKCKDQIDNNLKDIGKTIEQVYKIADSKLDLS